MLSDEEKEALDKLSSKKNETTWDDTIRQIKREEIRDVVVTRQKYITSILNIIEKQSKEIEELKEDKYGLEEEVQMQAKNIMICENALCEIQDKIKAKIEEVKDGTFDAKIVLQSLLEKE